MSDGDDAYSALKAYMKVMSEWERQSSALIDKVEEGELELGDVVRQQMESLHRIEESHCADTKWRRSKFRVTSPPEYDLRGNKLMDTKVDRSGKVHIQLLQEHLSDGVMKVEMCKVDGKWKVARRWITFPGQKPIATEL